MAVVGSLPSLFHLALILKMLICLLRLRFGENNSLCSWSFEHLRPLRSVVKLCGELRPKISILEIGRVVLLHEVDHLCDWRRVFPLPPEPFGRKTRNGEDAPVDEDPKLSLVVPGWKRSTVERVPIWFVPGGRGTRSFRYWICRLSPGLSKAPNIHIGNYAIGQAEHKTRFQHSQESARLQIHRRDVAMSRPVKCKVQNGYVLLSCCAYKYLAKISTAYFPIILGNGKYITKPKYLWLWMCSQLELLYL